MNSQNKLEQEIEITRNSLSTDRLDMSFGEIISMYEKDEIIINPDFQRLFRWTDFQKSRFIETILLGIPIPPIFVAEDKQGKWELVDGLQRLSTVFSFFGILKSLPDRNNWTLEEGDLVKNLDGLTYDKLPLKFQLNIKRSTCRIEIIRWNSKYDMRFELFNRLNTGGSPLTNQEIRNCIYRGASSKFNNFIKKLAKNSDFLKIINPSDAQLEELYVEELVLRFISLLGDSKKIKISIDRHMTEFMKQAVNDKRFKYQKVEERFNKTVKLLSNFDSNIFRFSPQHFATALYDIIMIGLAKNIEFYNSSSIAEMTKTIEKIKQNSKIRKSSGRGGNSKERVKFRLKTAQKIFGKNG